MSGFTTQQMDAQKGSLGGTSGGGAAGATLSTLANYPRAKINKLISEARPLIGGARKCRQIWQAIKKADVRKEGFLNETNIRLVFESCKQSVSAVNSSNFTLSDFRLAKNSDSQRNDRGLRLGR